MANVREQLSGNDIPVTIRFMMFSKEATMQSGSEPVPVQKSSVKFTLDVSEWPFADESDYLYFHLLVSSSREENFSIVTTFRESGQIRMVKMKGSDEDGLFMQFPKTGIVDSQNQFVDVSVNSESQQGAYCLLMRRWFCAHRVRSFRSSYAKRRYLVCFSVLP
jgi:hypothetical protein